jgi:hypothetical protein
MCCGEDTGKCMGNKMGTGKGRGVHREKKGGLDGASGRYEA